MLCREEFAGGQVLVHGRDNGAVGGRCWGRLNLSDQVWRILITGFRQMHLVANPFGGALFAILRLNIVRRTD